MYIYGPLNSLINSPDFNITDRRLKKLNLFYTPFYKHISYITYNYSSAFSSPKAHQPIIIFYVIKLF